MNKKILIVAAHPDDEVLGCFGTVSKMIKDGYLAYTLILSGGKTSRGEIDKIELEQLKEEMFEANRLIGIKKVYLADFPDNMFDSIPLLNIVKKIEEIKNELKPEIIFTHHSGDMNIDHRITHQAVLTASRPMENECVKTIYSMEIPSSTEWNSFSKENVFIANTYIDISDTIDLKVESMSVYKSELREYPHPRSLKFIKDSAKLYGASVGLTYCERFSLIRSVIN